MACVMLLFNTLVANNGVIEIRQVVVVLCGFRI